MTTIAWDGKALAADKLASSSSGNLHVTKIRRLSDGRLVGGSGDAVLVFLFMDWLEAGSPLPRPTWSDEEEKICIIEVMPGGQVYRHEAFGRYPIACPCQASTGTGAAFARGAMAAGKSAAEAVAIANELDCYSGGGVDVLVLHEDAPAEATEAAKPATVLTFKRPSFPPATHKAPSP